MEILSDTVFHGDVSIGTSTNPKTLKLYTDGHVLTIGNHTGETEMLHTSSNATFGGITANDIDVGNINVYNYMGVDGNMSVGFDNNPKTLTLYDGKNILTIGKAGQTEIIKTNGIAKFGTVNVDDYVSAGGFELDSTSGSASIDFGTDSWNSGRIRFYQHKTGSTFYFNYGASKGNYYIATQDQITSAMCGVARVQSLPITFDVPAECTRFYVPGANSPEPYSIQLFKAYDSGDGHSEHGYVVKNVDLGLVCGDSVEGCVVVVEKSSSFAMSSTDYYSIRLVYGV